ncbi:uncharacterized protein SRS1_12761 [Sporisorium reilianum f. sp. reilianum]|uniref:B30.2/SPRY domain-containing protein n=1 Tax=Sporisorium reilianum f. sp. reilianum TaxID=72559 RepID=A0A2N8U9Q5_9BASI|nr:uncharacterized protein SRS1_12761 [Sporisorium reilianum f. sp. reilianum]
MKALTLLLPLVVAATVSCTPFCVNDTLTTPTSYDVRWKHTKQKHTNQTEGGLGISVSGFFPAMSQKKIGLGCGLNWKDGQLYTGFNGGDPDNGVGGGFEWRPNSLSGIVGMHFKDVKINLNVTITDENTVLFNVNGKEFDWSRVV